MIRSAVRSPALAALLSLAAASAACQTAAPAAGPYAVLHRTVTGGDGGWDYLTVDAAGGRVFLSRGTHVMVVDLRADSVVGDIPATPGVHGVALAPELGKGFTSNGRDSSVTVFNLSTLAPIGRIDVPRGYPRRLRIPYAGTLKAITATTSPTLP